MGVKHVRQLDLQVAGKHYLERKRTHLELRRLFDAGQVNEYVELALGMTNSAGNYSAYEHGLGRQILTYSNHRRVFDFAMALDNLPNVNHLPKTIYDEELPYLKISVGSEIATMLRPDVCWVGNKRTIWAHLLLKHGSIARAKLELGLYDDNDRSSEMDYQIWRELYLLLEPSMVQLSKIATDVAREQSVTPGGIPYLWADAVASALFHHFVKKPKKKLAGNSASSQ